MQFIPSGSSPSTPCQARIPVGISACLMGQPVRYNGGHSRSRLCLNDLEPLFDYRSFCPELSAGFGVPRPTLRLQGAPTDPRLVFSDSPGEDVTARLQAAIAPYLERLGELDGYILMKNSPSCGLERIKLYRADGRLQAERTQGLFAAALRRRFPDLPVEEEGRLHDAQLRENFLLRVFAHHRFRHQVDDQPSRNRLMAFHRDYKYVLMAHSQSEYRALGRLLGGTEKTADPLALRHEYHRRFMAALSTPASRRDHCNVLLHLLGYFKRSLDGAARRDIVRVIEQYRRGEVNLATPLALIRHYARRLDARYLHTQRYLAPYPSQLGLSSQV